MHAYLLAITTAALLTLSAVGVAGQDDDGPVATSAASVVSPGPLGTSLADWNLEHLRNAPDGQDCAAGDRGEVFFLPRQPLTRADCRIGADQHILLAIGAISCSSDDALVSRWRDAKGDKKVRNELAKQILEGRAEALTCLFSLHPQIPRRGGPAGFAVDGVVDPFLVVDGVEIPVDDRYFTLSTPAVLEGYAYRGGPALVVEAAYLVMLEPLAPGSHVIEYGATYPWQGELGTDAGTVVFAEVVDGTETHASPSPSASPISDATLTAEWTLVEPRLDVRGDIHLEAVAGLPTGTVVAVGLQEGGGGAGGKAFAWHTSDPEAWTDITLPGRKDARIVDVVTTDAGFVAIGSRLSVKGPRQVSRQILVWRSADGRSWDKPIRIEDARAADLLVTDEGLAVLGTMVDKPRRPAPTLWRSRDGRTFEAAPIAGGGHSVGHIARSPSGTWIVVGERMDADGYAAGHVLWRSEDARTWDEVELPFADARREIDVIGAGWTPSGFVLAVNGAFLGADGAVGSIWHSSDGRVWELVATSEVPLGSLATGAGAQLVFGDRFLGPVSDLDAPAPLVVLTSPDGRTWRESDDGALDGVMVTAATSLADGRVVVAGRRVQERERLGGVASYARGPVALLAPPMDAADVEQSP